MSELELVELAVEYIRDSSLSEDELRVKLVAAATEACAAHCIATTGYYPSEVGPLALSVDDALSALHDAGSALDVEVVDGRFDYTGAAAGVKTKAGLLRMFDERPDGTRFEDIKGVYPDVALDVHRLWKRGRVIAVQNPQHTEATGDLASSLKGLVLYPRTRLYGHRCCMRRLPGVHSADLLKIRTSCDLRALVRRGDAIVVSSGESVETFRVDNFDGVRHVDYAAGERPNGAQDQSAKLARYSVSSGCELDTEGRERPRTIRGERDRGDSDNAFTASTLPLDRPCDIRGEVTLYRFGVANDIRALWGDTADLPEHADMIAELETYTGGPVGPAPTPVKRSPPRRKRKRARGLTTLKQTHLLGTALGEAIMRGDRE